MYRKGKDIRKIKKDIKFLSFEPTYQHLAAFAFVPSVFWREVYNS
jgi:hypothetical protein